MSTASEREVRYAIRDEAQSTYRYLLIHDVGNSDVGGAANTAAYTSWTSEAPGVSALYNSIIYNVAGQGVQLVRDIVVANVTVYRSTGYGVMSYEANENNYSYTGRNVLALGNNTGRDGSASDIEPDVIANATHLATSDASAYGFAPLTGVAAATTFIATAAGAEDLHLLPTASVRASGADLSALFLDDVDGDCRGPSWDIGADQAAP